MDLGLGFSKPVALSSFTGCDSWCHVAVPFIGKLSARERSFLGVYLAE